MCYYSRDNKYFYWDIEIILIKFLKNVHNNVSLYCKTLEIRLKTKKKKKIASLPHRLYTIIIVLSLPVRTGQDNIWRYTGISRRTTRWTGTLRRWTGARCLRAKTRERLSGPPGTLRRRWSGTCSSSPWPWPRNFSRICRTGLYNGKREKKIIYIYLGTAKNIIVSLTVFGNLDPERQLVADSHRLHFPGPGVQDTDPRRRCFRSRRNAYHFRVSADVLKNYNPPFGTRNVLPYCTYNGDGQ